MRKALRKYSKFTQVWAGGLIVLILVLTAVCAPLIMRSRPEVMNRDARFLRPSPEYPFGADNFGRDVFSRVVWGARISLTIGTVSVLAAASLGATLGLVAGFYGGGADWAIMRVMDLLLTIPSLMLSLILLGILGSSLVNVALAISIVRIPVFARIARGEILSLVNRPFVEAAKSSGSTDARILLRHLLPNTLPMLIIQVSVNLGSAILVEAGLSYLGVGTQPPTPSWGLMINEGRDYLERAPWMAIFPGLALMLTVVGCNLLGDGLRDFLDPRLKSE
jgi:ABC-type dipeptide/oligopeptide/nickel transport system permease subunit